MVPHEQVRPLAIPSPEPANLESAGDLESRYKNQSLRLHRRRKFFLCCCGCVGVAVVLFGFVVLVLALVFRINDPSLTVNSMRVSDLHKLSTEVDFVLTADLFINNPNNAPYKFGNSTTTFFYLGKKVAEGRANGGKVGTDRDVRRNVTVQVRATPQPNVSEVRIIELNSHTEIDGSVNVLGIYKRSKNIVLNCTLWPDLSKMEQEVNKTCQSFV